MLRGPDVRVTSSDILEHVCTTRDPITHSLEYFLIERSSGFLLLPKVFVANCRPHNWDECRQKVIFGIKKGNIHPRIEHGDLFLMRVSGIDYGVRGIWTFDKERKIQSPSEAPWTDAEYEWLLSFSPLVLEFQQPFNEKFEGKSKYSDKIHSEPEEEQTGDLLR